MANRDAANLIIHRTWNPHLCPELSASTSYSAGLFYRIAFMRNGIMQAKFTTTPRIENGNFRFYHELIPKAVIMKRITT